MQGVSEDRWVRLGVAAKRLGCSSETARKLVLDGFIKGRQRRPRGVWEVPESEIARYLAEIEHAPTAQAA